MGLLLATAIPAGVHARTVAVEEQSIDQLQAMMQAGKASSVDLVLDRDGPCRCNRRQCGRDQ